MVAQQATPRVPAEGRSQQQQHFESITTCAFCGADRNIYQLGDGQWVCVEHIGLVVSLAANDVFSDCVSYSREFERVLM